ncbi:MAG: ATP-binding protein, partial [Planctomycetota bacterium]
MSGAALHECVRKVSVIAERESANRDDLSLALQSLASDFESHHRSALALITETAADGCRSDVLERDQSRVAVLDLCVRLGWAIDTRKPFDFSDADPSLMELLFPSEEPTPASEVQETEQATTETVVPSSDAVLERLPTIEAVNKVEDNGFEICGCSDKDLLAAFFHEAIEHLETAELLLLDLEANPQDTEAINGLFRSVHSVKGAGGVLELESLGRLAHLAESALMRVRSGEIRLQGQAFELVLAAIDWLQRQVVTLSESFRRDSELRSPKAPEELLVLLEQVSEDGKCDRSRANALLSSISSRGGDAIESPPPNATVQRGGSGSESMRVDSDRLEHLIDLIGELVITESSVQHELNQRETLTSATLSTRLRKVVRDVQQLSLTLKMVPIGMALQKMNRLVRDLSTRLGKPCRLEIEGGDTEVDKTLLDCVTDPLIHLVRNSIDHGIETDTEARLDAGKPEVATIRIRAEHRVGNLLIHLSDDGRGLNRAKILERAITRGLVHEGASLTDHEIDQLIFEPGFSTSDVISDLSGRGVGMDVVRRRIEDMRGTITVDTEPGRGTSICLELPLTLSIIDGTVVRVGTRSFIIPTLSVVEQVQADSLEFSSGETGSFIRFRDRFIAASRLGEVLSTPHATETKNGPVCMIVEASRRQIALIGYEVVGQKAILINPRGGVLEAFDF